jgi:hypothetical protein
VVVAAVAAIQVHQLLQLLMVQMAVQAEVQAVAQAEQILHSVQELQVKETMVVLHLTLEVPMVAEALAQLVVIVLATLLVQTAVQVLPLLIQEIQ